MVKLDNKRVFLYAQIDLQEKNRCHKIIEKLNGKSCFRETLYVSDCTHVVVQNTTTVCNKILGALASNKHVVSSDYLTECEKAGEFLDEEPFIPPAFTRVVERIRSYGGKVFKDMKVLVLTHDSRQKVILRNMLRDGGATLYNWTMMDLANLPPRDLLDVQIAFVDSITLAHKNFASFVKFRREQEQPVKVNSFYVIFKLILAPVSDRQRLFTNFDPSKNRKLFDRLHANDKISAGSLSSTGSGGGAGPQRRAGTPTSSTTSTTSHSAGPSDSQSKTASSQSFSEIVEIDTSDEEADADVEIVGVTTKKAPASKKQKVKDVEYIVPPQYSNLNDQQPPAKRIRQEPQETPEMVDLISSDDDAGVSTSDDDIMVEEVISANANRGESSVEPEVNDGNQMDVDESQEDIPKAKEPEVKNQVASDPPSQEQPEQKQEPVKKVASKTFGITLPKRPSLTRETSDNNDNAGDKTTTTTKPATAVARPLQARMTFGLSLPKTASSSTSDAPKFKIDDFSDITGETREKITTAELPMPKPQPQVVWRAPPTKPAKTPTPTATITTSATESTSKEMKTKDGKLATDNQKQPSDSSKSNDKSTSKEREKVSREQEDVPMPDVDEEPLDEVVEAVDQDPELDLDDLKLDKAAKYIAGLIRRQKYNDEGIIDACDLVLRTRFTLFDFNEESKIRKHFMLEPGRPSSSAFDEVFDPVKLWGIRDKSGTNNGIGNDSQNNTNFNPDAIHALLWCMEDMESALNSRLFFKAENMRTVLDSTMDIMAMDYSKESGLDRYQALVGHQCVELFLTLTNIHPSVMSETRDYYRSIFCRPPLPKFILKLTDLAGASASGFHASMLRLVVDLIKKDLDYWWKHQSNWRKGESGEPLVAMFLGKLFEIQYCPFKFHEFFIQEKDIT